MGFPISPHGNKDEKPYEKILSARFFRTCELHQHPL